MEFHRQPLRTKKTPNNSAGKLDTIVDIHTNEGEFYTEVFSWGCDKAGQLGLGIQLSGEQSYPVPRFCSYNITIRTVSCGLNHAAFITQNNYIYSMGSNNHGQLGIDDPIDLKNSPILVDRLPVKRYAAIGCGGN